MTATPNIPGGPPLANPWVYKATDYAGKSIMIILPWNGTTRALQNGTIEADDGCKYSTIYFGVGASGKVTDSFQKVPVAQGVGTQTIAAGRLSTMGLNTIDDIINTQVTAA